MSHVEDAGNQRRTSETATKMGQKIFQKVGIITTSIKRVRDKILLAKTLNLFRI